MISILENYSFVSTEFNQARENRHKNKELLCIKTEGWQTSLVTVKREDATAWEIFKSYLGVGKLAGCDLRLKTICQFLEKELVIDYDLKGDTNSKAYKTVHGIAARMLLYRKTSRVPYLWEMLATETKKFKLETYIRHKNFRHGDYDAVKSVHHKFLLVTPLTKVGHLAAQASLLLGQKGLFSGCKLGGFGPNYNAWYRPVEKDLALDAENVKKLEFRLEIGQEYDRDYHSMFIWDPHGRPIFII